MRKSLLGLLITGLGLSTPTYSFILPNLTDIRLSSRISQTLTEQNILLPRQGGPLIRSPHYTEPSLIFNLGTNVLLGHKADDFESYPLHSDHIWIIDMKAEDAQSRMARLHNIAATNRLCLIDKGGVEGISYNKGNSVALAIIALSSACTAS